LVINVLFFLAKKKEAIMTSEISTSKGTVFHHHETPGTQQFKAPTELQPDIFQSGDFLSHNQKRQAFNRCCSRIRSNDLAGSDLVIEYLYGKYIKNYSFHTIRQSCRILLSFLEFLEGHRLSIYTLTRQDIISFAEHEQDRGLKTVSVIHHLDTLYAFISFLVRQGVLPYTIKQYKVKLKKPDTLPRAIPREDMNSLLSAIKTFQDRALILLLLRTGMRIGELLQIKMRDIVFSERKILIYQGEKNYQGRAVYYSKDAEHALQQWLPLRGTNSQYLFAGSTGMPLSYTTARRIMFRILQQTGLSGKGYSLHNLRHTFATDMLNAGMRIEVLQQLLGHQEIGVTMRYAKLVDQTREREYFKAMDRLEEGERHEPEHINTQLQKVFEKKKLLLSKRKKLSE